MVSPSIPIKLVAAPSKKSVESTIYRPFFLAGILSVLTAGCALGAIALAGICMQGSYVASVWTPYVLAHANSQLFGWVGFFIIGFTLQQHTPRPERAALFQRLARLTLIAMSLGIGLRFAAEPMAAAHLAIGVPLGVISCLLQLAAVFSFLYNVSTTREDIGGLTWQTYFIFASLFYLAAITVVEPFYFVASHGSETQSIQAIAHWAPILRDSQFLGFVANMIFGVSLIRLSRCFGFASPLKALGLAGFFLWNGGLALRLTGWNAYFGAFLSPDEQSRYVAPSIALSLAAILIAISSGVFSKSSEPARSHKFVRASYAWLLVAGAMMLLEPLHLRAIGAPFSHAYIGAVRHAATVGFISQMILGFGLHVASRMNGVAEIGARSLWIAFILLNVGNSARVALEVMTDYNQAAFRLMGPTGFVELTGLAIWAAEMIRILQPFKRPSYAKQLA